MEQKLVRHIGLVAHKNVAHKGQGNVLEQNIPNGGINPDV